MKLLLGDCLDKLKELDDNSIDSIVTDPPYGLSFMGKKWDYDVPSQEIFEECLRVLKPGGHLLSFAGSRTYHRMAVRIEDAGFEIRDQIMWIYGSGFPKSHNIGKAVDKIGGNNITWFGEWLKNWRTENNIPQSKIAKLFPSKTGGLTGCVSNWELGKNIPTIEEYNKIVETFNLPFKTLEELEREVIGKKNSGCFNNEEDRHTIGASKSVEVDITKGSSPYEGWGTALKPAHEPIVMARKPFKGSVAQNVLEWGTGGINIDESRIGTDEVITTHARNSKSEHFGQIQNHGTYQSKGQVLGRFPANIIFDEEAGKILDEQSGISKSSGGSGELSKGALGKNVYGKYENNILASNAGGLGDIGGASRFFYCPKTSKTDRNEGLEDFKGKQIGTYNAHSADLKNYGGSSLGAASMSGNNKMPQPKQNFHPTVKPTDLMLYLIRMVTPKGGTTLDPFMGSGSTGKAAVRGGFDFVGIEREQDYKNIAEARIQYEIDNPYNEEKGERIKINKNANKFW